MSTPNIPNVQPNETITTTNEHKDEERRASSPVEPGEEITAAQFVAAEVRQARAALQWTSILGLILLVIVGGELLYIATRFEQSLHPRAAAEITEGLIVQQVQDKGPELAAQFKEKVPELLAQTPDYILEQLPSYRQTLEDRVETELNDYCQKTSQQLGQRLDNYLETHQADIKEMISMGNDPEAAKALGDSLKQELLSYIKEKPEGGESIMEQINTSLSALEEIEKKTKRMAEAKNLTLQEKRTRRAIGILANSIDKHHQQIQSSLPSM